MTTTGASGLASGFASAATATSSGDCAPASFSEIDVRPIRYYVILKCEQLPLHHLAKKAC
jgi:hypothetical protein